MGTERGDEDRGSAELRWGRALFTKWTKRLNLTQNALGNSWQGQQGKLCDSVLLGTFTLAAGRWMEWGTC